MNLYTVIVRWGDHLPLYETFTLAARSTNEAALVAASMLSEHYSDGWSIESVAKTTQPKESHVT